MKKRLAHIFLFLIIIISSIGVSFASFNQISNENNFSSTGIKDTTSSAVCYNKQTGTKYSDLKKALDSASSNQEIITYINANITCYSTLTIKTNVTLTIPFVGLSSDASLTGGNVSSETTLYKIKNKDDRNSYGNTLGDSNATNVSKYRSVLLNLRNGADIINYGTLNLGGVSTSTGNNGYYSEINLGLNSSIVCESNSTFNCYGYVKENYDDAINSGMEEYKSIIDNSADTNRYILIKSDATINTNLAFYDLLSAGNLTGMLAVQQCPFNIFDFQCLQTYTKFESGSTMNATAIVVGPNNMTVMKDLVMISNSKKSSSALLYLENGTLAIEYKPKDVRYSSRSTIDNTSNIILFGELELGYLYLSEYGGAVELDTRNFYLPISSKLAIYVMNGSIFNCNQKIKFLMGSKLIINERGILNINSGVAFYNSKVAPAKDTTKGIYYDSSNKDDALLCCNGTINLNADSSNNAYLGAIITHTNSTGTASLNFSKISNSSYLSTVVEEGTSSVIVTVTSNGKFLNDSGFIDAQFTYGQIYTSSFYNNEYCWNGKFIATFSINVNIDEAVLNPVLNYTIMLSENADGSSSYESSLINKTNSDSTNVSSGIYFNLVVTDAVNVEIKKGKITIEYNTNDWIYIDDNFVINITPSEGVKISLSVFKDTNFSDNESKWNQGTGHTIFHVSTSINSNGTFEEVFKQQCSSFTYYVKKGLYFKISYSRDQSDFFISLSGMNGFTANNRISTNNPSYPPQPSTEWINDETSSESGVFKAGDNGTEPGLEYKFELGYYSGHAKADDTPACLLPNTLITMADGSYKEVKDIKAGDFVKVFNHETGKVSINEVLFNDFEKESYYKIINLKFSNGEKLGIVYEHGFFNIDLNKYIYITEDNYKEYIGDKFLSINSSGIYEEITLIDAYISIQKTKLYSPITYKTLNYFTNDLLSMPGECSGLFNIFEYDPNTYKYDEVKKRQDIEKYGLFTLEDFNGLIDEYIFDAFNCQYLSVAIGKGILTWEMIEYYVNRYSMIMDKDGI